MSHPKVTTYSRTRHNFMATGPCLDNFIMTNNDTCITKYLLKLHYNHFKIVKIKLILSLTECKFEFQLGS